MTNKNLFKWVIISALILGTIAALITYFSFDNSENFGWIIIFNPIMVLLEPKNSKEILTLSPLFYGYFLLLVSLIMIGYRLATKSKSALGIILSSFLIIISVLFHVGLILFGIIAISAAGFA